jgi:dTDP-glucose 4,6-dehydratase
VIVRPFNNFGPRQHLEKLIPRFITSALMGDEFTLHGDGSAARDFIFVEDTCRGIDAIMHAPTEQVVGEVFNVASGKDRSILEVAKIIARMMDYDTNKIRYIADRPGQIERHTGDAGKIKRVLSWEPRVGWEQGLQRTIDWFRANVDRWRAQLWMRSIPIRGASGKVEIYGSSTFQPELFTRRREGGW